MSVEQMSEEQMRLDDANHPLVIFREIKKQGFLGIVIGEHPVSDKTVSMVDRVSNRTRMEGTANNSEEIHAVDRLCYDWYLLHQFASFTNQPQTERALSYEVEYIIAGKDNDRDNLERVVVRMLGMRELQNCLTILKNPQMLQQTHQTALAIAGATANPVVIQAVQVAVVAIWALVESVLDLRTLLDGGKIPVLKSQEQWTSQLASLGQYLSHQNQANDEEQGLSYEHYLAAMVVLLPQKQITLRSMDLMEASGRPQVKKNDLEAIRERTMEYIQNRIQERRLPTVEGWAVSMGITRDRLYDWLNDQKVPEVYAFLRQVHEAFSDSVA